MAGGGEEPVDLSRNGDTAVTTAAGQPERRERRRGRKRERGSMVEPAEFTSYYGRPILKKPRWKNPDVPGYLWLGGMAGTSAVAAALGEATGRPALRQGGRYVAAGGALLSTVALIHDLGRPERFLNMLRVIKPTSPLSVGTWILSPFAAFASAAAASEATGIAPRLGRLAGWGAALFGPPLASYTGVLLANTAVPAWHEAHRELPVLFVCSGAAAGAGSQLVIAGIRGASARERAPMVRLGVAGATAELAVAQLLERRLHAIPGDIGSAYDVGKAGRWNRLAQVLTAVGGVGALFAGRSRVAAVLAGTALAGGSLATRLTVFEAGVASTGDPRHVVAPQRARLEAGERASAEGSWLAGENATAPVPRS
jgi:formate-dependent nitrite reductase membrane component NrfD